MPNPVFRETGRALVAALLAMIGIVAIVLAWILAFVGLFDGTTINGALVATLVLSVSAPLATWAILADERPPTRFRRTKLAVVLVTMGALALATALAVRQAVGQLDAQPRLGTPARDIIASFAIAVGAVLAIAATVCAVRWPAGWRRPLLGIGALSCVLAVGGGGAAATIAATRTGCDVFRFDAARWRVAQHGDGTESAVEMTYALARCHVLRGLPRERVATLLGRQGNHRRASAWTYAAGTIDGGVVFDADRTLVLTVRFGPDDRVADVETMEIGNESGDQRGED
jgi:hypothetical protein